MQTIRIKKGLDIPLRGTPSMEIEDGHAVRSVAVLGSDYVGLKPRMMVREGDRVNAGDCLFIDKRDPDVHYVAPASGKVVAVHRGRRRVLLSVVIELDDNEKDAAHFEPADDGPDELRGLLQKSGLWTTLRTRPYGKVPLADSQPSSLFVTAIDTRPLSANPETIIASDKEGFHRGLRALASLTRGELHLCTNADWSLELPADVAVRHTAFTGPHPAGLPGTHIHHLDPVHADKTVWHINYQDVLAIGRLLLDGRISVRRVVALGGNAFRKPRLVRTRIGANVDDLLTGELADPAGARLIVGSVLGGRTAAGPESYLGRYHQQISAIVDRSPRKMFGWLGVFSAGRSFTGIFRGASQAKRLMSTAQYGRPAALLPIDAFERVLPFRVPTVPLLRALLVKDTDQAQALGCLEMEPEDLALCSFVCPGKNDYGSVLRLNLELIEREG